MSTVPSFVSDLDAAILEAFIGGGKAPSPVMPLQVPDYIPFSAGALFLLTVFQTVVSVIDKALSDLSTGQIHEQ